MSTSPSPATSGRLGRELTLLEWAASLLNACNSAKAGEHPKGFAFFADWKRWREVAAACSVASEMVRFDIAKLDRFNYYGSSFHASESGSWVAYADILAIINAAPQASPNLPSGANAAASDGVAVGALPAGVAPLSARGK